MLLLTDEAGMTCIWSGVNDHKISTLFTPVDGFWEKETLIERFRIRDMVRETSDMIHQSIFCRKKSKETKTSFENSDRPSVQWFHERSLESRARHVKITDPKLRGAGGGGGLEDFEKKNSCSLPNFYSKARSLNTTVKWAIARLESISTMSSI